MTRSHHSDEMPVLKEWLLEATRSLAYLDAERLEELAASCRLLNRQVEERTAIIVATEALSAKDEIVVLKRVLEVTAQNLRVVRQRGSSHLECADYRESLIPAWTCMEAPNGDH